MFWLIVLFFIGTIFYAFYALAVLLLMVAVIYIIIKIVLKIIFKIANWYPSK